MIENFRTTTCRGRRVFKVDAFVIQCGPLWAVTLFHSTGMIHRAVNGNSKVSPEISPHWTGKLWWDISARTLFQNESRILNRTRLLRPNCALETSSILTFKCGSSGDVLSDKMSNLNLQTTRSRQTTVEEGKLQSCWCRASSSLSWETTCMARCARENDKTGHWFSFKGAALSFWATEFLCSLLY